MGAVMDHDKRGAVGRIIPAKDLPHWKSGLDLLQHARIESEFVLGNARAAAAEASAEGHREGYAAGLAQAKAACGALLVSLEAQQALGWRRLQPTMRHALALCFSRLVGSAGMPDFLQGRLQAILDEARPRGLVRVRVHGGSAERVRQAVQLCEADYPDVELFRVVADDHLSPDDLVIETQTGVVDGRLESQLAAIGRGMDLALAALQPASDVQAEKAEDSR